MTGLPGTNLKNIYIINGEYFSLEQLSAEQQKQIEENGDRRAYSAYRSTLLEAYGEDLEANIFINTDIKVRNFEMTLSFFEQKKDRVICSVLFNYINKMINGPPQN